MSFPFSFKIKYQQFSHILSTQNQLTGIEHFNAEFPPRCICFVAVFLRLFFTVFLQLFRCSIFAVILLQYFCSCIVTVFLQLFCCSIFAAVSLQYFCSYYVWNSAVIVWPRQHKSVMVTNTARNGHIVLIYCPSLYIELHKAPPEVLWGRLCFVLHHIYILLFQIIKVQ